MNLRVMSRDSLTEPRNTVESSLSGVGLSTGTTNPPLLLDRISVIVGMTSENPMKEIHGKRRHDVVREGGARQKQRRRGNDERQECAFLVAVQAGRDESPELVRNHRKGKAKPHDHGNTEKDEEFFLRRRENQLRILAPRTKNFRDRFNEEIEKRFRKRETDEHPRDEREDRTNQSRSQFREVLDQGAAEALISSSLIR